MNFKQETKKIVNNDKQFAILEKYVLFLEEQNKLFNLTGFSGQRLWKEAIYESIICFENLLKNNNHLMLVDIGSGAGFPSVVLKIVFPNLKVIILEPLKKRVKFLNELNQLLNLNITIYQEKSQNVILKEQIDIITARAVADLKTLINISYHLGSDKTNFYWIKGPKYQEEIFEAQKEIEKYNLKINTIKFDVFGKKVNIIQYSKNHP